MPMLSQTLAFRGSCGAGVGVGVGVRSRNAAFQLTGYSQTQSLLSRLTLGGFESVKATVPPSSFSFQPMDLRGQLVASEKSVPSRRIPGLGLRDGQLFAFG